MVLKLVWRNNKWCPDLLGDWVKLKELTGKTSLSMEEYDGLLLPAVARNNQVLIVETSGYLP